MDARAFSRTSATLMIAMAAFSTSPAEAGDENCAAAMSCDQDHCCVVVPYPTSIYPLVIVGSPSGLARSCYVALKKSGGAPAPIRQVWLGQEANFETPCGASSWTTFYTDLSLGADFLDCEHERCNIVKPYFEKDGSSATFYPRFGRDTTTTNEMRVMISYEQVLDCGSGQQATWQGTVYEDVDCAIARSTDFDGDGDTDQIDKMYMGRKMAPGVTRPSWLNLNTDDPDNTTIDAADYMVVVDEMARAVRDTAKCLNQEIVSFHGNWVDDLVPPNAVTLSASAGPGGTTTISWTAPGDDYGLGIAASYDLRWSGCPLTESNFDNAIGYTGSLPDPAFAGTSQSVDATVPSGATHWALRTYDHAGNAALVSNDLVISQPKICDLKICGLFKRCALVGWTSFGGTEIDFRYSTSNITSSNFGSANSASAPSPASVGQHQEFFIDNLSPNTNYYFAMKWKDGSGNWSPISIVPHQWTPNSGSDCNYQAICSLDGNRAKRVPPLDEPLQLSAPMPNPTGDGCLLRYSIPNELAGAALEIAVFDVSGRRRAVVESGIAVPGAHSIAWGLRGDDGGRVRSGVYFIRFRSGGNELRRTLVVKP
jgi:hypothetical protein